MKSLLNGSLLTTHFIHAFLRIPLESWYILHKVHYISAQFIRIFAKVIDCVHFLQDFLDFVNQHSFEKEIGIALIAHDI